MVSSIAGSSTVTFLLITGLIAAAATAAHQLMVRLEELKEQFQNQTRQLQKLEERLEQWEKKDSD